jgi:CheY-like chemotaxis protein
VELPLGAPLGTPTEPPSADSTLPVPSKRILVVDDEAAVADLLAEMLIADGHQVDRVSNGIAALAKLRAHPYDLILSDVRMPKLDGPGLYRELAARTPELARRLVFVTGDALSPDTRALIETSGRPSLSKPFTVTEVRRAVQRA